MLTTAKIGAKNDASANAAATYTLAAATGTQYVIHAITGGYDATPTGGAITTTGLEGGQLAVPVSSAGPLPHLFPLPIRGAMSGAVTVTLAAGGADVTGVVQVHYTEHKVA